MKKLFLLTITAGLAISSFAQSAISLGTKKATVVNQFGTTGVTANKTTTIVYHDSILMQNNHLSTDSPYLYTVNLGSGSDSGYFFGNSLFGLQGFAERYDFNAADSTIQVLGIFAGFSGIYNSTTTKNATFKVWSQGPITASSRATLSYNGFPNNILDSSVVSYKNLGIDAAGAGADTFKTHYFTTPTAYLTDSFFVGCTLSYNWAAEAGDTITVLATDYRITPTQTVVSGDTVANVQNAVETSTGSWLDLGVGLGTKADFFMFPIVNSKVSLGVHGVSNKNFTFFGNYPNPAVSNTNVKFALTKSADVTIMITDLNGNTINTINQPNLSVGEHIVNVSTANLATGDYLIVIRTTDGSGIASKFAVIK